MRPTKVGIQKFVAPYLHTDERGEYLLYDEAEEMLDKLMDEYVGIMSKYLTYSSGREELIITTVKTRTELGRYRVKQK